MQLRGALQHGPEILPREGVRVLRDLLRGAGGDDGAAAAAAFGAEVDDIVGAFDDVEIVLNDDDRIARINELIQHLDQPVDIGHMQAGGRLVEDIDGLPGIAATHWPA